LVNAEPKMSQATLILTHFWLFLFYDFSHFEDYNKKTAVFLSFSPFFCFFYAFFRVFESWHAFCYI